MFSKPTKKTETDPEKAALEKFDQNLAKQVHVMPSRYYQPPQKSNLGLVIAIIIGLLIIGVLAVAAFYLNEALKKAAEPKVVVPPIDLPVNENINVAPEPEVPLEPTTTPEVIIEPELPLEPTSTPEVIVNTNTNPEPPVAPIQSATSVDSDKDNLSDAEEALLGTDKNSPDTDKDGYDDGSEVLSGYDPKVANKKLADSGLFNNYKNSQFSTIYPNTWRVKENDVLGNEVLFISGNGQFFEILVLDNPNELELDEWFNSQFADQVPVVTAQKINAFEVLKEADNLNYYLMDPADISRIFLLTYNIGNAPAADFMTLFVTTVKNFKIIK
jgi:hypothetical protein